MWNRWPAIIALCVLGAACGSEDGGAGGSGGSGNEAGGDQGRPPISQVTNNAGVDVAVAKVGDVEFVENLSGCGDGCSTGFEDVLAGDNVISVQLSAGSAWEEIGTLGPFDREKAYSVNLVQGAACAELWELGDTSVPFNETPDKAMVTTSCP